MAEKSVHALMMERRQQPRRQEFAKRLKRLRQLAGLTQSRVAERMGRTQGVYAKWETGYSAPLVHDVVALCRAIGASPDALFGWNEVPSP